MLRAFLTLIPGGEDVPDILIKRLSRIDFDIVVAECVRLQMVDRLSFPTISALLFPVFYLGDGCVHTYPEHIKRGQQHLQIVRPTLLLDNMLDQQINPRACKRWYGTMKASKEGLPPTVRDLLVKRTKAFIRQLVRRVVVELRFKTQAECLSECCFSSA